MRAHRPWPGRSRDGHPRSVRVDGAVRGLTATGRRAIAIILRIQPDTAMPVRLNRSSADFDQRFVSFLAAKREASDDVRAAARAIVHDVANRGDTALIEATRKFDRLSLDASGLRVSVAEIEAA